MKGTSALEKAEEEEEVVVEEQQQAMHRHKHIFKTNGLNATALCSNAGQRGKEMFFKLCNGRKTRRSDKRESCKMKEKHTNRSFCEI